MFAQNTAQNTTASNCDRQQVVTQLKLLGYSPDTAIFLRAIKEGKAQKITAKNWSEIPWNRLQSLQNQGFNLYLVVNGGGHVDADVTGGKVIFYEHDNLKKDIQADLWQHLGLPQPTLQVDTGGKSIHSYWTFVRPIPIDQWKALQADLLEYADADRAIKNPSRVMRLAGSIHQGTGQPAAIISQSGERYSYEQLRAIVPAPAPPEPIPPTYTSYADAIPLENCLSKQHREILANGVSEGGRNQSGAALARDLIGTAARLAYLGIRYEGDPRQLLDEYGTRCNPPLPAKELDAIWKSAQKSNPTACLSDDFLTNCVKAWELKQQVPKATGQSLSASNLVSLSQKNRTGGTGGSGGNSGDGGLGEISLRDRILEILTRNGKESDRQIAFIELSKAVSRPLSEIKNLADILESENSDSDVKTAKRNLEKLISAQSPNRLKISDYLWGDNGFLANAIETVAKEMPSAPEFLFTTLIPVAASQIGTSSRIIIKASSKYVQNCVFWTGIVARSGQAKTPAQKVIIKPLTALEVDANKQFKEDEKNYETELADYKKSGDKDDEKPDKPTRKRYLTTDITVETLARVHGENPRGLLYYRDELAGMFKARNQYKKGAGSDEENEISQFNGDAIIYDRADKSVCLERSAVSRTGSIQWEIAQNLLNQANDSNGGISRWLFCAVDAPPRYLNLLGEDSDTGIDEMLRKLYTGLGNLAEEKDYLVTKNAVKLFQEWQHTLVDRTFTDTRPGFCNIYPKIESYTARLALWLHLCNAVLAGESPAPSIDERTMAKAIELAKFYLGQAELIYGVNSDDGLTGDLLRLYRFCDGKGEITARQVKQSCYHFKKDKSVSTATIKGWFGQLAEMGHGTYRGDKFVVGVVGGVVDLLLKPTTPETHTAQGLQKIVVDVVDVVEQKIPPFVDELTKGVEDAIVDFLNNTANNQPETLINQDVVDSTTTANNPTTPTTPAPAPQTEDDAAELDAQQCGRWIKEAIASGDPQAAKLLAQTLKNTCADYPDPEAHKLLIWSKVEPSEQDKFKAMVAAKEALRASEDLSEDAPQDLAEGSTEKPEFKVGDRVFVTKKALFSDSPLAKQLNISRVATIAEIDRSKYCLQFESGFRSWFFELGQFELNPIVEVHQPTLFD